MPDFTRCSVPKPHLILSSFLTSISHGKIREIFCKLADISTSEAKGNILVFYSTFLSNSSDRNTAALIRKPLHVEHTATPGGLEAFGFGLRFSKLLQQFPSQHWPSPIFPPKLCWWGRWSGSTAQKLQLTGVNLGFQGKTWRIWCARSLE